MALVHSLRQAMSNRSCSHDPMSELKQEAVHADEVAYVCLETQHGNKSSEESVQHSCQQTGWKNAATEDASISATENAARGINRAMSACLYVKDALTCRLSGPNVHCRLDTRAMLTVCTLSRCCW